MPQACHEGGSSYVDRRDSRRKCQVEYTIAGHIPPVLGPLFGTGNQLLATIALAVVTTFLVNMGKVKYAWITAIPMCFVGVTTLTAGVLSIKNINLPLAQQPGKGFQGYLDSTLMVIFIVGVVLVLIESAKRCWQTLHGAPVPVEAFGAQEELEDVTV